MRMLTTTALLFSFALPIFPGEAAAEEGETKHSFYVDPKESYSDYIQFTDGHGQGVCVFYFAEPVGAFNRLVVFCRGEDSSGKAYEDLPNKRIVLSRALSEYTAFSRFQQELGKSTVYGAWVTRADGEIVKIALQIYRNNGRTFSAQEPAPPSGAEYTGKSAISIDSGNRRRKVAD